MIYLSKSTTIATPQKVKDIHYVILDDPSTCGEAMTGKTVK
jgi:hypothetical protein